MHCQFVAPNTDFFCCFFFFFGFFFQSKIFGSFLISLQKILWFSLLFCTQTPIWKVVCPKRKEFAPRGSKFFPFRVDPFSEGKKILNELPPHTPISTQSRNSVVFKLQPMYFFLYFFTKAYVVGTHLNCISIYLDGVLIGTISKKHFQ